MHDLFMLEKMALKCSGRQANHSQRGDNPYNDAIFELVRRVRRISRESRQSWRSVHLLHGGHDINQRLLRAHFWTEVIASHFHQIL